MQTSSVTAMRQATRAACLKFQVQAYSINSADRRILTYKPPPSIANQSAPGAAHWTRSSEGFPVWNGSVGRRSRCQQRTARVREVRFAQPLRERAPVRASKLQEVLV